MRRFPRPMQLLLLLSCGLIAGTSPAAAQSERGLAPAAAAEESTVGPPDKGPAPDRNKVPELRTFRLRQIEATAAENIISQLFKSKIDSLAVDERSNSLIVLGNSENLHTIGTLLVQLDSVRLRSNPDPYSGTSDSASVTAGQASDPFGAGGGADDAGTSDDPFGAGGGADDAGTSDDPFGVSRPAAPPDARRKIDPLRRSFTELDRRSLLLAEALRKAGATSTADIRSDHQKELARQLRDVVQEAFKTRQQLQRLELAAFAQRMKRIQESLELRDRIANQIVRRRIDDLLNPKLDWDKPAPLAAVPPDRAATDRRAAATGTLPSLAASVEAEVAQAEAMKDRLQGRWVLSRTAGQPTARAIVIEGNMWHFHDPDTKTVTTAHVNIDFPSSKRFVAEFEREGQPHTTWLGEFEFSGGKFTIRLTGINSRGGGGRRPSPADLRARLLSWSGVYQPLASGPEAQEASSTGPPGAAPDALVEVVQPVLDMLRGTSETLLAPTTSNDEWADDIDRIRKCEGHQRLAIDQAWLTPDEAFLVTTRVKDEQGKARVVELFLKRIAGGHWALEQLDDEPADNGQRDIRRFQEAYPNARRVPFTPTRDSPDEDRLPTNGSP